MDVNPSYGDKHGLGWTGGSIERDECVIKVGKKRLLFNRLVKSVLSLLKD